MCFSQKWQAFPVQSSKHSSLVRKSVNCGRKKFYNIGNTLSNVHQFSLYHKFEFLLSLLVSLSFHPLDIMSSDHFVELVILSSVIYQLIILSTSHFVNQSFCQPVILSTSHFVNQSFCQVIIMSTFYFIIHSFCELVIFLTVHFVVIFPIGHFVNQPFYQQTYSELSFGIGSFCEQENMNSFRFR